MIRINDYANEKLYHTFSEYLGRSKSYGPPPIFYWFRNIIAEVRAIDTYTDIATGSHKYNMSYSLGVVYYTCKYVKTQRVIIITDFEFDQTTINNRVYSGRVNRKKRTIKLNESQLRQIIADAARNDKRTIRVTTESHLRRIIENAVRKSLMEMR